MELQIDKAALSAWRSGEISFRSLLLHTIGCLAIGTPESLEMPGDFYYIEGDRNVPHPKEYTWDTQRALLYVDTFRRDLTRRVARWCLVISLALFLGGLALQGLTSGVKTLYRKADSVVHSMLRTDPAKLSHDDAATRLKEVRVEYMRLRDEPSPDREQMQKLDTEAKTIITMYPDLRTLLQDR